MIPVLLFAENNFERVELFATVEEAKAFAWGFSAGGNCYGAGSPGAYLLPHDEADLRESEPSSEVARALAELARKQAAPK